VIKNVGVAVLFRNSPADIVIPRSTAISTPDDAAEKTPVIPSLVVSGFWSLPIVIDSAMLIGTNIVNRGDVRPERLVVRSFNSSARIRFLIATAPSVAVSSRYISFQAEVLGCHFVDDSADACSGESECFECAVEGRRVHHRRRVGRGCRV
jgi:hypothetical protein